MNEISIGAVGAAGIAALVSMLGLIIGKEQKISEFRQAWINDLRKCIVDYLVNINAICDIIRLQKSGEKAEKSSLLVHYRLLNEASHGIELRINDSEEPAKALLGAMKEFESLAQADNTITPENIKKVESAFIAAAKGLLKFEWQRVKKGERIFVVTKWLLTSLIITPIGFLAFNWYTAPVQKPFYEELAMRALALIQNIFLP